MDDIGVSPTQKHDIEPGTRKRHKSSWCSRVNPTPVQEIVTIAQRAATEGDVATVYRALNAFRTRGERAEAKQMRQLLHEMEAIRPHGAQRGNQNGRKRGWRSLYAPAQTSEIIDAVEKAAETGDSETLHAAAAALKYRHKNKEARITRAITAIVDADEILAEIDADKGIAQKDSSSTPHISNESP